MALHLASLCTTTDCGCGCGDFREISHAKITVPTVTSIYAFLLLLAISFVASWGSFVLTIRRPFRRFTIAVERIQQFSEIRKVRTDNLDPAITGHYKWLDSNGGYGAQIDVNNVNLNGYDLHDCRLDFSVISNSTFESTDLSGASFDNASLENSRFAQTLMYGTRFHHANLRGADLTSAIGLQAAQLAGADLSGVLYRPASLSTR